MRTSICIIDGTASSFEIGTAEMPDGARTPPGQFALIGPTGKYLAVDDAMEELM